MDIRLILAALLSLVLAVPLVVAARDKKDPAEQRYVATLSKAEAARETEKGKCENLKGDKYDACVAAADKKYDKAKDAAKKRLTAEQKKARSGQKVSPPPRGTTPTPCEGLSGNERARCLERPPRSK